MSNINRYYFELNINLELVKKKIINIGVYNPRCMILETINNIKYISFVTTKKLSKDMKIKIKNLLNPNILKRNSSRIKKHSSRIKKHSSRIKKQINYDESLMDDAFEYIFQEN